MARKRTIRDVDYRPGSSVLVRVDYNVPFDGQGQSISDDSRIIESLPTIQYLRERQTRVVLCAHRGRPGRLREPSATLAPVADRLTELLGSRVRFVDDCVGEEVRTAVAETPVGGVVLLENLRFHPGEETNDPAFSRSLAELADYFVNDGFGAAHRGHASTSGVAELLPSAAGLLMEREMNALMHVTDSPEHPYAVVTGGAKVADKIPVLENLAGAADVFMVGGGMVAAFLAEQGSHPAAANVEEIEAALARRVLDRADAGEFDLMLPVDVVVSDRFSEDATATTVPVGSMPKGSMILDIGPETLISYSRKLSSARTVVWNGPMGVFEWPQFASGTHGIATAIADLPSAFTVIGGGSTADAVRSLDLRDRFSHVSTGGGAALEYLEGRDLPGISSLDDA